MDSLKDLLVFIDNEMSSQGSGGHRTEGSVSTNAILAAFIPTFITALVYLMIFVQVRGRYPHLYSSRTFKATVPKKDRTPMTGLGKYDWFKSFVRLDEKYLLRHGSLDSYLFMRFLKTIVFICFVGACLTWPILFPVNATGGGNATELDRISFSNVSGKNRLYAHAVVACTFLGFVMFTIARERTYLRELRQAWYLAKPNAELLSSRTVLFLNPAKTRVSENDLESTFGDGARKIWPMTKLTELEKVVSERNTNAMSLENAEVQYIIKAAQNHERTGNHDSGAAVAEKAARPSHRLYPVFGQKVDAITWYRQKVSEEASKAQQLRDAFDPDRAVTEAQQPAIFVEYSSQAAARKAYHHLTFGRPLPLDPRYIGIQPKEVLWENLAQSQTERLSKKGIATVSVVAIIILWAIPISIIGTISNVNYLADNVRWLEWIKSLPPSVLGLLTGFLPPLLVSSVVSYVPKLYRKIARRFEATTSSAELLAQAWYFAFQLIQIFLITTVTSGATAVAAKIAKDPKSIPDLLAQNLPKASNFYLTYFILQGTVSAAQNVLNYSDLLEYIGYDYLFDRTPRAKYERYMSMKGISWCSVFPKFANFAVIAIAYSCIAPLTLGFAAAGVYLYYLSYRYNLLFVIQPKIDTKGEAYALALQHVLTGVYLSELCLIGLFGARKAAGPTVIMVILLILTIFYHLGMNRLLRPVERYLPDRLQPEDEERPLVDGEDADYRDEDLETAYDRMKQGMPDWVPKAVLDFLERFFVPDSKTRRELRLQFEEDLADYTSPSEDQLKTAYLNPALTSKTPKLWLVKDGSDLCKQEMEENEKENIASTTEGAELDGKHRLVWDKRDGCARAPIFKEAIRY